MPASGADENEGLQAHPVSWALWEVLQTADEAEHVLAGDLGLSYTDTRALSYVMTAVPPLGPVELGRRLGISSASATVLTDRLVASGHLSRQPHPDDARRKTLAATPFGWATAVSALTPLLNALDRAVDSLSDRDVAAVSSYLHRVAERQRAYCARQGHPRERPRVLATEVPRRR